MSRHVVINGRELSMNDAGFIDPNSEWSVTVGEDGSVEVNRLDLKEENAKLRDQLEEQKCFAADLERDVSALRELVADMWEFITTPCNDYCERCVVAEECSERQDYDCCQWRDEYVKRMRELGVEP